MTAILGISAFYHDSATALVVDGRIVAAAQEERFTRTKHDEGFPRHAIDYCLSVGNISAGDLDYVGFYDKPLLKFHRLLETYLAYAPAGFWSFAQAMPIWLGDKLHVSRTLRRELKPYNKRFIYPEHHETHAASAFFPSPYDEAAVLTVDGVGEWATATIGVGRGSRIELLRELRFPHSLGLLYSAFTYFCGFKVNSGEYKLMGLAPYGEPRYADLIREKLIDLKSDGSLRLNMQYFNYCQGTTMTSRRFADLFGGPPRTPESPLTQREMDLAASIQVVTEEAVLRMARQAYELTGLKNLCLAGGVALNCVANGRLLKTGPFENIWIQPAAGDAGGALGTALFIWHQLLGNPRTPLSPDSLHGSLLGPEFSSNEIQCALDCVGAKYRRIMGEDELCQHVAGLLAEGNVVGWMQGRMEFGPRALGSRSILGDPRDPAMQSRMNLKIKFRESFRPFAPAVLAEEASKWFELADSVESPYMLLTAQVAAEHQQSSGEHSHARGFDRLKTVRSTIPAVTHVDGSARVQTVDNDRNPRFHRLLSEFHLQTGCPVLINTSFNVRGEPIVCTPQDAWRCFMATHIDVLVIGEFVLLKSDQPQPSNASEHLSKFALD